MSSRDRSPAGYYLWDPWFSIDGDEYHVYFLQAPRNIPPLERHHHSSIGHAISRDLRKWKGWRTALTPADRKAFDDLALWTGCTFSDRGEHYLFYTGRSKDNFWRQTIGLARSSDRRSWERVGRSPILAPDPRSYGGDREINDLGFPQAWRDPFVFRCPESGEYLMTISAETSRGDPPYNACVALARSSDLTEWRCEAPIFSPGLYAQIEVTQIVFQGGHCYLFFSCPREACHPRLNLSDETGTWHCYLSDAFGGELRPANGDGMVQIAGRSIYNARLIRRDSELSFISVGWHAEAASSELIAELSDPFRTVLDGDTVYTMPL